ncbi:MAG: adenosylcobinamide-GDP ribazoletransferase, partial [Oscillospiraceae bacterium]|nr:adenosylcobinamide-GDP ribazoletransferase [Oscillospiraceae bacterium]
MKYIDAFFMALSMFCAVPCPYRPWRKESRKLMLFFFPFVGAVIGAIWALSVAMCRYFNVPSPVLGAVIAAMPYLLTGFFHLDGFM